VVVCALGKNLHNLGHSIDIDKFHETNELVMVVGTKKLAPFNILSLLHFECFNVFSKMAEVLSLSDWGLVINCFNSFHELIVELGHPDKNAPFSRSASVLARLLRQLVPPNGEVLCANCCCVVAFKRVLIFWCFFVHFLRECKNIG